jgi:hypothetical protein
MPLSYTFHGETNNTGIFTRSWNRFYIGDDANNCNAATGTTFTVVEPKPLMLKVYLKLQLLVMMELQQ